jgi:hypothetical protein
VVAKVRNNGLNFVDGTPIMSRKQTLEAGELMEELGVYDIELDAPCTIHIFATYAEGPDICA